MGFAHPRAVGAVPAAPIPGGKKRRFTDPDSPGYRIDEEGPARSLAPLPYPDENALQAWLGAVSGGDAEALEPLYRATSARVFGLVRRICRRVEVAEEVLVDTYAKVWENAARYRSDRGTVLAWIATIARRTAIDRLRQQADRDDATGIESLEAEAAAELTPFQASLESERASEVRRALGELNQGQRRAIEATFFEGLTHAQAAELLGQPLGTVKSRIRSGLLAIRDRLAPGEEGAA